jgi:hypothetical protein
VATLDMMNAGLLGDPYYRFNEIDPQYRDIGQSACRLLTGKGKK